MHFMKVGYLAATRGAPSCWALHAGASVRCSSNAAPPVRFCQTLGGNIPVIRVPRNLQKRIDTVKEIRGKDKINTIKAGKLLIQSRNPSRNQSAGYILGKFEQPTLCSKGWKHKKSFGDHFTINNVTAVAPFVGGHQKDMDQEAFKKLRLCKELVEVLHNIDITHPTTVQRDCIPKIMKGHNILCAAETGSGKTLSYLLPAVHRLQADKACEMQDGDANTVRTVVLVPSRELADQVAAVSRTLCAPFGFLTKTVGGGRGVGHIKGIFRKKQPDILVATPGALVKALRRRCLDLSQLNFFVVDEADTMFDPSFSDMLEEILQYTDISRNPREAFGLGRKAQLLVIGATFPGGVGDVLSRVTDLGSMVVVKSKMLHFLMPHVKQTFLKVKGADKMLELHQALKKLQQEKEGAAVLVFCNKSATVNWLGYMLDEMGVQHLRLQGEMPAAVRAGIFQAFQKGMVDVLVCTDIGSRGLDTSRVRLVVNYDCPETHTDYIHRAGRVGRAGGAADVEVLSFVCHPWDVELVQKIETAARRRSCLPGMKSAISEPKPDPEM